MNEFVQLINKNLDGMFIGIIAGFVVAIASNKQWPRWKRIVISFLAGILMLLIYTSGQYIDKILKS